jgi:nucleotide-binding universal stress UspA family protein
MSSVSRIHDAPRPPTLESEAVPDRRRPRTASVIVGLDGSPTAWNALYWAFGEARRLEGRVLAVYVTTPATESTWTAVTTLGACLCDFAALEQIGVEKAAQLRAEVERVAADQDVAVSFVHAQGDAADALLRVAEVTHADVIAVGRSTKWRHQLAGSLGRRLMARANTPIIAVVP